MDWKRVKQIHFLRRLPQGLVPRAQQPERTLPEPRMPIVICSGGPAKREDSPYENVAFDGHSAAARETAGAAASRPHAAGVNAARPVTRP